MSEQAVPTETTENLVNLQPEPEAQEQQEDPIQIRPTEDQEDASFNDADTKPMDRPDYYPEKFWDEDGPDVKISRSSAFGGSANAWLIPSHPSGAFIATPPQQFHLWAFVAVVPS